MGKRKAFFKGGGGGGGGGGSKKKFRRGQHMRSLNEYNKIKGILYTCSTGKEYDASQEAINLMNEYSEDMIEELEEQEALNPTTQNNDDENDDEKQNEKKNENDENDDETRQTIDPTDVSKHLEQEVNRLKEEKVFEALDTGVQGMIFVRINHRLLCPVKLLTHMFEQFIESENNINCRFIQRCIPVTSTCHAKLENFKQMVDHQTKQYIAGLRYDDPSTVKPMFVLYGVIYKAVYSTNAISKQDCLDTVTPALPKNHVVDLKNPQVAVFVYLIKNTATFAIVTGFNRLYEFNINSVRKLHEQKRKEARTEEVAHDSDVNKVTKVVVDDVIEAEFPQQSEPVSEPLHLDDTPSVDSAAKEQQQQQQPQEKDTKPSSSSSAPKKKKKSGKTVGGVRLF